MAKACCEDKTMEDIKLIEKIVVVPERHTTHKHIFLSNIDLSLLVYLESVSFFDPPVNNMSFSDACNSLYSALSSLLVPYDFFAGRLVINSESFRFEIDCNGAGVVVAAAKTDTKLSQLGNLQEPKAEFKQLVAFLHEKGQAEMEQKDVPLLLLQFTQFGCGSLALASRYNHCVLDGISVREFAKNLAALTRMEGIVMLPNPDRTIFRARNPPMVNHPHYEYSKVDETDNLFTVCGNTDITCKKSTQLNKAHSIYLSPQRIAQLKNAALQDGKLKKCSTFQVVAAKIWKTRSIVLNMEDNTTSTMLFPVDVRKIMAPPIPSGFAGNAIVPGFAQTKVKDLKEVKDSFLVKKVQEGMERLDDAYVRSGIDWLEVHRGVLCKENSFSVVAWFRLGLEEDIFSWGKVKCLTPVMVKPSLVFLLPGPEGEGGINVWLEMAGDQMGEFCRLLMEY